MVIGNGKVMISILRFRVNADCFFKFIYAKLHQFFLCFLIGGLHCNAVEVSCSIIIMNAGAAGSRFYIDFKKSEVVLPVCIAGNSLNAIKNKDCRRQADKNISAQIFISNRCKSQTKCEGRHIKKTYSKR